MDEIIQIIGKENLKILADRFIRNRSYFSLQRLDENLRQLESRNHEYQIVESIFRNDLKFSGKNYSLGETQMMLLNKVEAFHQQVYATISTFIQLINYIGLINQTKNFPINSVISFLSYISKVPEFEKQLDDEINILKKSVNYRDKFVDHPQSMQALDWATTGFLFKYGIVYYAHDGDKPIIPSSEKEMLEMMDPDNGNFHPPFYTKTFFVSPNRERTINAVKSFIAKILINRVNQPCNNE